MSGFRGNANSRIAWTKWVGDPDDNAAHQAILTWLEGAVDGGFLDHSVSISNRIKGNLGEFIAYRIGRSYVFTNGEIASTANASEPLSDISKPGIDIVWMHFGDAATDDWVALQEVKTTGQESLQLADGLIDDYDKLFGKNLRLTLQTRLTALKNELDEQGQGHFSARINQLGGPSPDLTRGIRLFPTLLHDAEHDSSEKMVAVRQAIIGQRWSSDVVECWSIALGDLDARLSRLAKGL